jgi:uncharacterized protein YccT (UPF0319 family)
MTTQRTREEMIDALRSRIHQTEESMKVIADYEKSYWRQEAVREELQTFLDWAEGR